MRPLIQIDDDIREMNDDEFAKHQIKEKAETERQKAILAKAEAKAALLTKLGITADEAALLLG